MTAAFAVNSSPLHNCSAAEFCTYGLPLRQDPAASRRILFVGKNSYIGSHLQQYLGEENYTLDELNARGLVPAASMFYGWDTVVFLAAIVHQKETAENRELYYAVNRDLAIKTAEAAKEAGVRHFIIMSTMSVYGVETGTITKATKAAPVTHYGSSKQQADEIIWAMRDDNFMVTILRPPMVYGKGCHGNYQLLRSFVLSSPVFPAYENRRSMIFIENLCTFMKEIIDLGREGVFFPQDSEYVCTSELVRHIAAENNHRIIMTRIFNPLIRLFRTAVIKKVFGSLTYEQTEPVSAYSFKEAIRLTERQ
ncbi:MAG: NAD-dependent epimerase/dehydratase family protein [Solobacterium sp.]|nr:NAD-dependent epimerase/dehydratase family protein [Solobacterium sp.]